MSGRMTTQNSSPQPALTYPHSPAQRQQVAEAEQKGIKLNTPERPEGKMESPPAKNDIRELTQSEDDFGKIWLMWQSTFPKWPIGQERMQRLLYGVPGQHYIHENGFCLSSIGDGAHGKIVAVGVLPGHRGKGLGTALVEVARAGLVRAASEHGGQLSSIEVGSLTPRFWPHLPVDFPPEVADFFLHRGIFLIPPSRILAVQTYSRSYRLPQVHGAGRPRPLPRHPRLRRASRHPGEGLKDECQVCPVVFRAVRRMHGQAAGPFRSFHRTECPV